MRSRTRRLLLPSVAAMAAVLAGSIAGPLGADEAAATEAATPDPVPEPTVEFTAPHTLTGSYLAGRLARGENDTVHAAGFYRSALDRDPGNQVLLEQAFLMEAMDGATARTMQLGEQLIAADPQHRTARLFLGLKEFKEGNYKKSEEHFRAAASGPIGELTSALALSWVKLAEGDAPRALAELDVPKQAEWAQFYLRYHRALVSDQAGRRQDARAAYERVFRQDSKALRTTLSFARHAAHTGDAKMARAIIREHVEKNGGEAHPLVRSLMSEIQAGGKSDLLVATPAQGLSEAFYGLGEALIGEGAVPAGILYMQMALYVEPDQQFALAALANAHESTKRYEDAIAIYDRIPKNSPLELPIEIRKAYNLNSLERVDEARKTLTTLLDKITAAPPASPIMAEGPEDEPGVKVSEARPLKLGSKGEDVRQLQEALNSLGFDTGEPDGRFGDTTHRAVIAFQESKGLDADGLAGPETAGAILSAAHPSAAHAATPLSGVGTTAGDQLQVLDALGNIQRSRKLYADSTETYTRAIALIPKIDRRHWNYFYARGTSYERLKNWTAAEADLQKALELAPEQPHVLNYLGYSWIDQGLNLKQGMALIEKAVALKPDDGYIVDSLGWAHFKLGNYKDAVRYLERAVELKPDDPVLNDHLGDALWRTGREREARFQWDQALSLNPEPEDAGKIKTKIAEGLPSLTAESPERKTTEAKSPGAPKPAQ